MGLQDLLFILIFAKKFFALSANIGAIWINFSNCTTKIGITSEKIEIINKINKKIGSIAIKEIRFIWTKIKTVIAQKALKY